MGEGQEWEGIYGNMISYLHWPYKKAFPKPGVVAHAFNPSTWEAEAGGFLSSRPAWSTKWVPGQPGLHRETLSQKNQKKKQKTTTTTKNLIKLTNFVFPRQVLYPNRSRIWGGEWHRFTLYLVERTCSQSRIWLGKKFSRRNRTEWVARYLSTRSIAICS